MSPLPNRWCSSPISSSFPLIFLITIPVSFFSCLNLNGSPAVDLRRLRLLANLICSIKQFVVAWKSREGRVDGKRKCVTFFVLLIVLETGGTSRNSESCFWTFGFHQDPGDQNSALQDSGLLNPSPARSLIYIIPFCTAQCLLHTPNLIFFIAPRRSVGSNSISRADE